MSTAPPTPGRADRLTAALRLVASPAAADGPAGRVIALILALLTDLIIRLADLMERIAAGEYQPLPRPPRQPSANPENRQRCQLSGTAGRQPAAMPATDGPCGHLRPWPRDPGMTPLPDAVAAQPAEIPRPDRRPSRLPPPRDRPGAASLTIARDHHRPRRREAHHGPAPWHADFVPL